MPPEARLAGLILLLVYPAGLAAQTELSTETRPYSSNNRGRDSEPAWVTTSRPAAPSAALPSSALPSSGRLDRAESQLDEFLSGTPEPSDSDDSPADGIAPDAIAAPSLFPAMPPSGARTSTTSAPAAKSSARSAGARSSGIGSLVTAGGSLALVLGLFLIMAWLMRRAVPGVVQALPGEVVQVLGRAPLAGRQQVHLIRCGNKLILISVTPEGAETLTEITEPEEVDRLAGLCQAAHPGSATNAFRHVFGQLARQRTDAEMMADNGELDLSGIGGRG